MYTEPRPHGILSLFDMNTASSVLNYPKETKWFGDSTYVTIKFYINSALHFCFSKSDVHQIAVYFVYEVGQIENSRGILTLKLGKWVFVKIADLAVLTKIAVFGTKFAPQSSNPGQIPLPACQVSRSNSLF